MAKGHLLLTISITLLMIAILASPSYAHGSADEVGWMAKSRSSCQGSMAECLGEDEEFGMESEVNRRILATSQYISYQALQKNTVPCSQRGASYYNCQPGASANPYTRSCSAITRCRS